METRENTKRRHQREENEEAEWVKQQRNKFLANKASAELKKKSQVSQPSFTKNELKAMENSKAKALAGMRGETTGGKRYKRKTRKALGKNKRKTRNRR